MGVSLVGRVSGSVVAVLGSHEEKDVGGSRVPESARCKVSEKQKGKRRE
jgi:hypothetical protein